ATDFRGQELVEHRGRRQLKIDVITFHFHREDLYRVVITAQTRTRVQRECLFVQWAGDFGEAIGIAKNTAGQNKGLLVRAHLLTGIPGATAGEIEDGNLYLAVLDRCSTVVGKILHLAHAYPRARRLLGALGLRPRLRCESLELQE